MNRYLVPTIRQIIDLGPGLFIECWDCQHHTTWPASFVAQRFPQGLDLTLDEVQTRMRCSRGACRSRELDVLPTNPRNPFSGSPNRRLE